jgi:hypothetical protein
VAGRPGAGGRVAGGRGQKQPVGHERAFPRQLGAWSGAVPPTPAERMGGAADRTGGAARRGVTPDSRVRSSRAWVGRRWSTRVAPGAGVSSSRMDRPKTPGEERPKTHDGST